MSDKTGAPSPKEPQGSQPRAGDTGPTRLSSETLAALIIDALVDAGLIDRRRFQEAVAIAAEEIEVRKTMGDF